ncbi:hypothetical protein M0O54_20075, partial [Acinetobacter lactucae]
SVDLRGPRFKLCGPNFKACATGWATLICVCLVCTLKCAKAWTKRGPHFEAWTTVVHALKCENGPHLD